MNLRAADLCTCLDRFESVYLEPESAGGKRIRVAKDIRGDTLIVSAGILSGVLQCVYPLIANE